MTREDLLADGQVDRLGALNVPRTEISLLQLIIPRVFSPTPP